MGDRYGSLVDYLVLGDTPHSRSPVRGVRSALLRPAQRVRGLLGNEFTTVALPAEG